MAVALGRNWQASWWEWHVLMLAAFALIAVMAHREGSEERFGRLYSTRARSRDGPVRRPPGLHVLLRAARPADVSQMLDILFDATIPAVEEHGGEIDRLIGDAVFATFRVTGTPSEQRVPRSRCRRQPHRRRAHPDWPRFRAGVNTGEAVSACSAQGAAAPTARRRHRQPRLPDRRARPGGRRGDQRGDRARALGRDDGAARDGQVKGRKEPVEVLLLVSLPPR